MYSMSFVSKHNLVAEQRNVKALPCFSFKNTTLKNKYFHVPTLCDREHDENHLKKRPVR